MIYLSRASSSFTYISTAKWQALSSTQLQKARWIVKMIVVRFLKYDVSKKMKDRLISIARLLSLTAERLVGVGWRNSGKWSQPYQCPRPRNWQQSLKHSLYLFRWLYLNTRMISTNFFIRSYNKQAGFLNTFLKALSYTCFISDRFQMY